MNPHLATTADDSFAEFLDFGAGVLSLVCLSCSVIWGLVAQDRVLLVARQRILAQAVHRATAVASIAFLLVHIGVKLALDHTTWIAAVLPFGLLATDDEQFGGRGFLIGLGTLAALLMIFVGVTGALRNRFASPAPVAARWRAMHMLAYPAWCAALLHGLYAGRAAKPLFTALYGLSVLAVMAALALRAAPAPVKRRIADRVAALFTGPARPGREEPADPGPRTAALPGYEHRDTSTGRPAATGPGGPGVPRQRPSAAGHGSFGTPLAEGYPSAGPGDGFAAAYRAVSGPPRARAPFAAPDPGTAPAVPRADGGGWPVPSPPPVGEAPPSAYDPLTDTGRTVPVPGGPGAAGYVPSDPYDMGETNPVPRPYYPGDTYLGGPATEPTPGAPYDFGAPDARAPWNTPSGGSE
ncbi:cytochrome b/b6 domain-containing protein [Streptomyces fumanus]|uniref:cytochrome b/b6 domain-containing protein n=1 Tax=Streptomyces fumanus TaxID=67302 RepID=UPI0033C9D237